MAIFAAVGGCGSSAEDAERVLREERAAPEVPVNDEPLVWNQRPEIPPELAGRIADLIEKINETHQPEHGYWTPAVRGLREIGPPAIPALLDVMVTRDDPLTLRRVDLALHEIMWKAVRTQPNPPTDPDELHDQPTRFWRQLGDLNWNAPREQRRRRADQWRRWMEEHETFAPDSPRKESEDNAGETPAVPD